MVTQELAVLCVDDEKSILNSLKRLLRKEPFKVYTALGGDEGLEIMAEHRIQVVVSDQRMPGMTGTQFLQKVKEQWPDTIRVILSGFAEADVIVDSINHGEIYRFVAKPWKEESLKTTIRQCFDHYRILQENRRLQRQTSQQLEQLKSLNQLLEASMEVRTKSLQLSQEIVEKLPLMIMGISREEELVLTNGSARKRLDPLQTALPGTEIDDLLPPEAVEAIRSCLTATQVEEFTFQWHDHKLKAHPELLGSAEEVRGCLLLLEEVDP